MNKINMSPLILPMSLPNPTYIVFLMASNMTGTLMVITSSSWLIIWLGLVINLLSLIPLLTLKKQAAITEAATKYFILQSLASTLLIMMILLMNYLPLTLTSLLLTTALMLKLGAAPLHFWVPQVIQHLGWTQILIISTWQKIAPLAIMTTFSDYTQVSPLIMFALLSMLVGALGAWTSPSLKHLLAFSSIHHTGWLILLTISSSTTTMFYFSIYMTQMITLMMILHFLSSTNKTPFLLNLTNSASFLTSMSLVFLSMAALPPFMGFMPKLAALLTFSTQKFPSLVMMFILLTALIMTSIYLTLSMALISPNTSATFKALPSGFDILLALALTTILYLPPLMTILI